MRLVLSLGSRLAPGPTARLALRLFTRPPRLAVPQRERDLQARGTPMTFRSGLVATRFGDANAKPVLLVHGWAGRGLQLGALVDPLVAADYGLVALDGPAHGASPGDETNPIDFARALVEVGAELGRLRAVVAHSFGGAAAVLALHRGLAMDGLVLIAAPGDLVEVLHRFSDEVGLSPRGAARLLQLIAAQLGVEPDAASLVKLAPAMHTPLLVIHDPADPEVSFSDAQKLAAAWPGAKLWEAHGLGHRRVLRAPEAVARVVAFVQGLAVDALANKKGSELPEPFSQNK